MESIQKNQTSTNKSVFFEVAFEIRDTREFVRCSLMFRPVHISRKRNFIKCDFIKDLTLL